MEHFLPSVSPVAVQVASTAGMISSVCAFLGVSFCATSISPHSEQCLPSVKPVVVQVASTDSSINTVCECTGGSSSGGVCCVVVVVVVTVVFFFFFPQPVTQQTTSAKIQISISASVIRLKATDFFIILSFTFKPDGIYKLIISLIYKYIYWHIVGFLGWYFVYFAKFLIYLHNVS